MPISNIKASLIDPDTDRYIYIRSRIITCDEANGNGDYLPKSEVIKVREDGRRAWETFIGTMIDYNHDTSIELGKTIDANFIDEKDGEKAYVEIIGKIDRKPPARFTKDQQQFYAKLISRIESGDLDKMSMEAYAENARCNYCKATFPFAMPCEHVSNYMNTKIKAADGSDFHVWREDLDITFVGSGIVENPADKRAEFKNIMAKEMDLDVGKKYTTEQLKSMGFELTSEEDHFVETKDEVDYHFQKEGDKYIYDGSGVEVKSKMKVEGKIDYEYMEQWLEALKDKKYDRVKVVEMLKGIGVDYNTDETVKKMVDSMFKETTKATMTAKEALSNISGLELMKIIDALDNGDSRVNEIVAELEKTIVDPIYEAELKIEKRLTSMEMNKIKSKLIEKDKMIDKSLNAQLIKLNGKDTWLIMKNMIPAMKRTLDEIWGEELKAEGKIDGMSVEEYAKSDTFKRRMLLTYQKEGQEYLERIWSKQEDDTNVITIEDVLEIVSKDYEGTWKSYGGDFKKCVAKAKSWAENPEGYCAYLEKKATGWPAEASKIEASRDEFKACIAKNMENKDIVVAEGLDRIEAVEAFCFKKVMGIQASCRPRLQDIFEADLKLDSVVGGESNFKAWLKYKNTGKFPTITAEKIQIKLFAKALNELPEEKKDVLVKSSNLMKYGFTIDDVKKYHILASEIDIKKLQKYDMTIESMRELFAQRFGF